MNFFNKLPKKALAFAAAFVTVAVMSTAAIASFGPDRPTRVWTPEENGFDYVTFNSYTDVPGVGDERDFLQGVVTGRDSQWQDPVSNVLDSDTITAKIYIHNNADPLLNDEPGQPGIARNVNVSIDIPTGFDDEHEVVSSISASNAKPQLVYDSLDIDSLNDSLFSLSYVPGSAKLGDQSLSDDIFTDTGISLDDHKGCFEYVREIIFELEVDRPDYRMTKLARIKGEDSSQWREKVNAKTGDHVEWRIAFENIGESRLEDVIVVDNIPQYTKLVPETTTVYNAGFPGGYTYPDTALKTGQINVEIGDFAPTGNAFLVFETVVEGHKDIACGVHKITNTAFATPQGLGTHKDDAHVVVDNGKCVNPVAACTSLTALVGGNLLGTVNVGDTIDFSAQYTATDVTINSFTYTVDGTVVQDTTDSNYSYVVTDSNPHSVAVALQTTELGRVTSKNCEKHFQAEEVEEPVYACANFTLALNDDREAKVTFTPVAQNGAVFRDATVTYIADGVTVDTQTTDVVTNGEVMSSFTFADDAENVRAEASVRFLINGGKDVVTADCSAKAVLAETIEKCEIPGFEHLPKDSEECVLPDTGAGSVAAVAAALTGIGAAAHRRLTLKRQ